MTINKKQKLTILTGLGAIFAALIEWIADGMYVFTQTKILVQKKDPLFGTVYKVWQKKFIWGLDLTLTITVLSIIVSFLIFKLFKDKTR
jgi:hypothetical protein